MSETRIWGIVNVTPDSFSDGGHYAQTDGAVAHAQALRQEGADVLDIGGESTRPGAAAVPPEAEAARVVPVIRALRAAGDEGDISVDTRRASVAQAALEAGATIVNDVSAARDPDMLPTVHAAGAGLVLMHMQGDPGTMQHAPHYDDVVADVRAALFERAAQARAAGIRRLWLDPGLGFGKTLEHNLALVRGLASFRDGDAGILLGASRKSFLGTLTEQPQADQRLGSSLACAAWAHEVGSDVRVHDVRPTRDLLSVLKAVRNARWPSIQCPA